MNEQRGLVGDSEWAAPGLPHCKQGCRVGQGAEGVEQVGLGLGSYQGAHMGFGDNLVLTSQEPMVGAPRTTNHPSVTLPATAFPHSTNFVTSTVSTHEGPSAKAHPRMLSGSYGHCRVYVGSHTHTYTWNNINNDSDTFS